MPLLEKIIIQDFRNIALQELEFSPKLNCISGGNGEGKTNLLEAIWYLSMTKSTFAGSEKFCFRHGCSSFSISGLYLMDPRTQKRSRFSIQAGVNSEKKLRRDDKAYERISDHIGVLPIVMVSPSDYSLVSESGDERRRFVNSVLSQMDARYLGDMQQYNRLLSQRNSLLKSERPDEGLLETFDLRLDSLAGRIWECRQQFVAELEPLVRDFYSRICPGRESVKIEYRSALGGDSLEALLRRSRQKDLALKFTTEGIHRDDFIFTMDSSPIRRCGSQGQQKSFLVALKFAQYSLMDARSGVKPILLLDDLLDKLDMQRASHLLDMVSGQEFGQIFISDSDRARTAAAIDPCTTERAYFKAEGGVFTRIDG